MADCIRGEEIVFGSTYNYKPSRTIRVPSGDLDTLTNEEVEPAAGYYDFGDASESYNRFIIWRSNRSLLLVEERSVECSLEYASLCFSFIPTCVLPGTNLFVAEDKLVLIVPTINALHRFGFDLSILKKSGNKNRSILSLAEDQSFLCNHDCYEITSGHACRASISHSAANGTTALYCLADGQIVLIQMRHALGRRNDGREKIIRGDGILQRVMKAAHCLSPVASIASIRIHEEVFFYVLFEDKRLHVYLNGKKEYDANLYDMMVLNSEDGEGEQVTAVMVKICSNVKTQYAVVLLHVDDHCTRRQNKTDVTSAASAGDQYFRIEFILARIHKYIIPELSGYFSFISTFQTEGGVVDIACELQNNIMEIACLCKTPDGLRYCMRSISINCMTGLTAIPWREINGIHVGDPELPLLLAKSQETIAAKKSYIFDPNRYSFGVVLRSLQLLCKQGTFNWILLETKSDWQMLREATEKYCVSYEFERNYVTREDRSRLATVRPNVAAQLRFWTSVNKMCSELMYNDCLSLALWRSVPLGLCGTIQHGRFTVCRPGDEYLRSFANLVGGNEMNVNICWKIVTQFATEGMVTSKIKAEQADQFMDAFLHVSHIFEDAIRKFTELVPVDEIILSSVEATEAMEIPYNGYFTAGLLATSFQRLIDDRLALSQCLIALMELVKMICSSDEGELELDARWESTVSTHERALHDINRQLTILSQAMKLRVALDHYHETSLADGFFGSSGVKTIFFYIQSKETDDDEDAEEGEAEEEEEEEEELEEEEGDDEENSEVRDESFDDIFYRNLPVKRPSSAPYSQYTHKIVTDAVIVLWPENTAMVLARFLSDKHQYSALQDYCRLNEPYVTELRSAFRYFEGVAFAGLKQPEKALQSFLDAIEGIKLGDEALNRVICKDGNVPTEPHTEVQFILKTMVVMEMHGFHEQLVYLARLALKEAMRDQERHARVLPGLFTSVFKFELITDRYEDALNTLLSNPNSGSSRICLRELLTKLLEKRNSEVIVSLNYGKMEEQVLDILKSNARTSDISKEGYYYDLIYAFHFRRDCYQRAALTMLEYSCRLQSELQNRGVLVRRCRALSTASSLLYLLPEADRFLALPAAMGRGKHQMEHIGTIDEVEKKKEKESKLRDEALIIWTLEDISKRALLSSARLALFDANFNWKTKTSIPPPIKLEEIFDQLIQKKLFDLAMEVSKIFDLKPYSLMKAVTKQCIRVDYLQKKNEPRWVLRNQRFIKNLPSLRKRHWAILQGYLEASIRKNPQDSKVLWEVTYTILQHQLYIPAWLTTIYELRLASRIGRETLMELQLIMLFIGLSLNSQRCAAEYAQLLIMFDHLHLAYQSLRRKIICETNKMRSQFSQTAIPVMEIDWLIWLIDGRNDPDLNEDKERLIRYAQRYFDRIESFARS